MIKSILVNKKNYRIRTGDNVVIITGKDKGKVGKIVSVNRKTERVIINGLNLVKRHRKPTQENQKGSIVEIPSSIHISNVMYYDASLKKGVRIKIKREDGVKIRYSHLGKKLG